MEKAVIGILAHVDAGKTTLAEAILYHTGAVRKMGRVDNGDTVMDTHSSRGNGALPSSQVRQSLRQNPLRDHGGISESDHDVQRHPRIRGCAVEAPHRIGDRAY